METEIERFKTKLAAAKRHAADDTRNWACCFCGFDKPTPERSLCLMVFNLVVCPQCSHAESGFFEWLTKKALR